MRKNIKLNLITRKRYRWDITCEYTENRKSRRFFRNLQAISYYFKPIEKMLTLPRNLIGYRHQQSDEEKEKGLKAEYKGDFELIDERVGLVPESVKPYLLTS